MLLSKILRLKNHNQFGGMQTKELTETLFLGGATLSTAKISCSSVPLADKGDALMEALRKIHVNLVVKDTYQFFQVPVDPSQAPQYTEIITRPMDFGTMFTKLEAEEYGSIDDYRADFELMCNNAMTYNMEATIYHKSAKRLLKQGLALIRKETKVHARILKQLEKEAKQAATKRREKSVSVALTSDEEDDSMMELEGPASPGDAEEEVYVGGLMQRQPSTMLEAQTLRHYATEAARNASNAINRSESRPHPLVFDRKGNLMFADEDTAAKMNFLTNERANAVCGKTLGEELAELPISYPTFYTKAALAAASTSGVPAKSGAPQPVTHVTGASQTNQLHLCAQLLTGPYSSHLPKADNRYSKLTAAQQKVVESTFGDEHVYSYACSLRKRAENIAIAPDGERDRVDSLITKLTDNRYKRTEWPSRSLDSEIQTLGVDKTPPVSAEELKVLVALSKEDGVDMKWLDTMFKPRDENIRRTPECVQDVLDDTSGLLWELEKVQAIRKAVGNTSSYKPEERALAQEIVTRLKQLLSIAYPQ
ncbi:hypothetical protein SARC_06185 [Sphaeroforma arctica JP610]|uniref:Bromo domain-containing protein n=1 Tax=Sphaeroforma arctica JP610 TaxID=667725 RepID=A0A0L0FXD7_9EUKA|nr:hypothetical protein SARC_06185 [Sphaeroforma arctica JP610]KNC81497.1 hypothetical protein SARC_06185 [Sphaeroforma arctica JP610]|eukprot:XP_014155399.1 hypothetical protein SARC_06185 [Sphaeroforma arctica JP610]